MMSVNFDEQVQRNLLGKQLEKDGRILDAIALYEANISENFEGSFPYRRLAILYRKRKLWSEEVRVLEKACFVFNSFISSGRNDIKPKLKEFREGLKKAKDRTSKLKQVIRLAKKRTKHIIHNDEVEIGPFQLRLMFGDRYEEDICVFTHSFFCDCGVENKKLIDYKSYINNLNDVILRGRCSSCMEIATRYIETGERPGIEKLSSKIRKLNKS